MLNINVPHFYCFMRREHMYQHKDHVGEWDKVLVFGAQSCAGKALTFHVMTDFGIVRSRVPVHMLSWKEGTPSIPLDHLQLWDCFHENVAVVEYDALFDCRAKVVLKDKSEHWGDYVMTFDWYRNAYSDEPTQYKCLHMIALDNGNYALQPNNRIFWKNMSFVTKPFPEKPDFKVDNKVWRCESESDRWVIDGEDDQYYYNIKEINSKKTDKTP